MENKRQWIETEDSDLSVVRQCFLAGLAQSSYYYAPAGESPENLEIMRLIDKIYRERPYYGSPRMTDELREQGWLVNVKRVARLMQLMSIQATVPGPHTSRPHPEHRIYPYLLRGKEIEYQDEVWCSDITYLPMRCGYLYLVAVMDWFSRYVLAWELSNSLETAFCVQALKRALRRARPGICNTDQGAQFTSVAFTGRLKNAGVQISMDGKVRGSLPARLCRRKRSLEKSASVFSVLQHRASASRIGKSNSGRCLFLSELIEPPAELGQATGSVSAVLSPQDCGRNINTGRRPNHAMNMIDQRTKKHYSNQELSTRFYTLIHTKNCPTNGGRLKRPEHS